MALLVAGCSSAESRHSSPAGRSGAAQSNAAQSNGSQSDAAQVRTPGRAANQIAVPQHVVVVVEENHAYSSIIGRSDAGYFTSLAHGGASLTAMYAITHPSEPNYLAMFAGTTYGLHDDSCPHTYSSSNLADQLRRAGRSFVGYSEGLPKTGYSGCTAGTYARKHAPWTDYANLPASVNRPLTAFPSDYTKLPSVSFVIPDLAHDMHDGTVATADAWLKAHLDNYRRWAATHHSLLVVTWDEDDHSAANRIPTIITGQQVRPGRYGEHADHYRLLRTVQWLFRLGGAGESVHRTPITDIWAR